MKYFLIRLIALFENKSIPQVIFESLKFDENFKDWAVNEIKLAGLYDKDSDYEGMLGKALEEIIEVISNQRHSGGSISVIKEVLYKLLNSEPLTSCNHFDYMDVSEYFGKPMFQCKRCLFMFSEDRTNWCDTRDK